MKLLNLCAPSAAILVSLFSLSPCFAQIVVDPKGGGNYRELQSAIDAASPGSVIRVLGGTYAPVTIRKSLKILCEPRATITQPDSGSGEQPPGILLAGGGTDEIVLSGFLVQNTNAWFHTPGAALDGKGFTLVSVLHSSLHGARWSLVTGDAVGASGIRTTADCVLVDDSEISASRSDTDGIDWFGPDGVAAIDAPGAVVVLSRSRINGGNGPAGVTFRRPPSPTICPCPAPEKGGRGGPGITAKAVFAASSQITAGLGTKVSVWPENLPAPRDWGRQSDGVPVIAAEHRTLPGYPSQTARLRIGQPWSLGHGSMARGGVVLIGIPRKTALPIGGTWLLLKDDPLLAVGFPHSVSVFTTTVPAANALVGIQIGVQVLDLDVKFLMGLATDVIDY